MSQQLAIQEKVNTLRTVLEKSKSRLAEVAPKHLKVDRLLRLMLSACTRTPKILDCTQESILTFCMKCSETGLEPIGAGGAWAIPYGTVLTFIPDYRGLVNCAKRADCVKDAYAEVVRQKDQFDYELGMEASLKHIPARGDRGELEAAYCIIVFPDDTKRFIVMDKIEVEGIKKRSKAAGSGPWKTDEAEMWKKTVVRRAMKPFVGMSSQLDAAIEADDIAAGSINVIPISEPRALDEPKKAEIDDGQTHSDAETEIIASVETQRSKGGVAPRYRWKLTTQRKREAFFDNGALKDEVDKAIEDGWGRKLTTHQDSELKVDVLKSIVQA